MIPAFLNRKLYILFALVLAIVAAGLWLGLRPSAPGSNVDHAGMNPADSGSSSTNKFTARSSAPQTALSRSLAVVELALREIEAIHDPGARADQVQRLAQGIDPEHRRGILEALAKMPKPAAARELATVLMRLWAAAAPADMAQWLASSPLGPERERGVLSLATLWAGKDFEAAQAWGKSLETPAERAAALLAVAYEVVRDQPLLALNLAVGLTATPERDAFLIEGARQWAINDPEAAAKWAGQIEAGLSRANLISAIATAWGEADPDAAAKFAVQELPSGKPQEDAVVGILQRWALQDPEKAMAWLAEFPEGELRESGLQNAIQAWANHDPVAAGNWLNTSASFPDRDVAISAYAAQVSLADPQAAAGWIEKITDADLRLARTEALASVWLAIDANAARAWVQRSALPELTKARLLGATPPVVDKGK
jgi:hypothetical protein